MKPYYEDEKAGIVIYHGDCREILLALPSWADASLFTDPPYGMSYDARHGSDGSKRWGTERVTGDAEPFDPSHLMCSNMILWGANWFANRLPDSGGWIVWDKTPKGAAIRTSA